MELLNHPLFQGMRQEEIQTVLHSFSFYKKQYEKDEYIILEGDLITQVGVILKGKVLLEKQDYSGDGYLYIELQEEDIFAEPFIGATLQYSTINYRTASACEILFFHYKIIWDNYDKSCHAHILFMQNLMLLFAQKTRYMLKKIEVLSKKHMRERILTYLQILRKEQNAGLGEIVTPYNRTELAKYLCVNRSALARELSKLKQEGILDYKGNRFVILKGRDKNDAANL